MRSITQVTCCKPHSVTGVQESFRHVKIPFVGHCIHYTSILVSHIMATTIKNFYFILSLCTTAICNGQFNNLQPKWTAYYSKINIRWDTSFSNYKIDVAIIYHLHLKVKIIITCNDVSCIYDCYLDLLYICLNSLWNIVFALNCTMNILYL